MRSITQRQFFLLLALAFFALNFVSFSSHLCEIVGNDGIFVLLAAGIIMYIAALCMLLAVYKSGEASLPALLTAAFGKFFGRLIGAVYLVLLIYYTAYSGRVLCEQVNIYMLSSFSRPLVQLIFFGFVLYALLKSFKSYANLAQLLIFPTVGVLLFLFVLCWENVDIKNMLPLGMAEPMDFLTALRRVLSYKYSSVLAIPFIFPLVADADMKRAKWQLAVAVGAAVVLFALYYILCVGTLGKEICAILSFPAINIMHSSNGDSSILLDRYESIIVFVSIILYFFYCIVLLKSAQKFIAEKLPQKKYTDAVSAAAVSIAAFGLCQLLDRESIGDIIMAVSHEKGLLILTPILCVMIFLGLKIKGKGNEKTKEH